MVELLGHPGALGVGLGGGQVFLGVLDAAIERGGIEFGERNGLDRKSTRLNSSH